MQSLRKDFFSLHISVFLFGAAGLFVKFVDLPSTIIVLGRVLFASSFLIILILYKKENLKLDNLKDYKNLILLGLLLAFHWFAFFQSIVVSTVAVGLITFSTFPVFTTFLEPIITTEKIEIKNIVIAIIVFAAVALVVPEYNFNNNIFLGALWGVASGLSFAIISVLNRKYVKKYSGSVIAFYQDISATIFLMPFLFIANFTITSNDWLLLALLGVVFTGVAHTLYIKSLKNIKAQTASIVVSLEPVYGILLAMLLLNEIPTLRMIIGGSIILLAVLYVTWDKKKMAS